MNKNNQKTFILGNNLTGKFLEVVDLLAEVFPEDYIDELLDSAKGYYRTCKKHPECKRYVYFDFDKETGTMYQVETWDYHKEDFE